MPRKRVRDKVDKATATASVETARSATTTGIDANMVGTASGKAETMIIRGQTQRIHKD